MIAAQEAKAAGKPVSNGRVYGMKGLCEFQIKNYEVALADLQKARDLGVDSEELMSAVRYHTAIIMTRLEQYEFALLNLQAFAQKGHDAPTVIEAFGLATLRMPMLPSELPADRREMVLLAGRGSYYQAARLSGPARPAFEELVGRYPDSPNVHYAYGVFLLGEDPDRALEEFKKELKQSPGALVVDAADRLRVHQAVGLGSGPAVGAAGRRHRATGFCGTPGAGTGALRTGGDEPAPSSSSSAA